jgi:anti-sigma B factor antagonist
MPVEEFSVQTEPIPGKDAVLLRVSGYLDAHTFEDLEEAIGGLFTNRHYRVVVDLSEVAYISSAGAGVFIGALSEAQENDGDIVLLNPTNNVREVFDLLGLSQVFEIVDTLAQAVAAFGGKKAT